MEAARKLAIYKSAALARTVGIDISLMSFGDTDPGELSTFLKDRFGEDRSRELEENYHNSAYWMADFESRLIEDLKSYPEVFPVIHKVVVGVIPHVRATGFVEQCADGSYVVCLNYGLFVFSTRIATALLLEVDKCLGGYSAYCAAVDSFYESQARNFFIPEINFEIDINIASIAGSIASLVFRFSALHEIGHVVLNHVNSSVKSLNLDTIEPIYSLENKINEEFDADLFAITQLLSVTRDSETMWTNIMHITSMFEVLSDIEKMLGHSISNAHPAPHLRAKKILNYIENIYGKQPDLLNWLHEVRTDWRRVRNPMISLSVVTENPDEIEILFEKKQIIETGFVIKFDNRETRRGMTAEEALLNFSISFVSGIPASIIASYIYNNLSKKNKNSVIIDDEVMKSLSEIEKKIELIIKNSNFS